jgi:hypothetical protein
VDRNHAAARGAGVSGLETLTQIPGMTLNFANLREEGKPVSDGANLRKLREQREPFKLDGKHFGFNMRSMIENILQAGEVAAKMAELKRALIERGLAEPANRGERLEGTTFVDGLNVRDDIAEEYRRVVSVETPAGWKKVSKAINQIPLLGSLAPSVEGLAHVKNQLIANFAPGMSVVDTLKNAVASFKGNKAFEEEMLKLSNMGAAKPHGEHQGVFDPGGSAGQDPGPVHRGGDR